MTKIQWPHQSQCDAFYGNPRGKGGTHNATWAKTNLVTVVVPFAMKTAWKNAKGGYDPITRIRIHRKCSDSLARVLADIWTRAGQKQDVIDEWGMNLFGGSFAFRTMRGGSSLSMHSWGCAIDIDPARNGLGDYTPVLTPSHPVALAFKAEGWVHGADWNGNQKVMDERRPDAMHFQAARL
jgi:hypothetical protein